MRSRAREGGTGRLPVFLLLFFVSGTSGLIYEIVWSRLLVFVFGGTTFAITTVLACFMGGLALGSYLGGRLIDRVRRPARLYGILEIGIGIYGLCVPVLLGLALPLYRFLAGALDGSFVWLTVARVLVSGAVLLLPSTLMGATLPLLSQAFARRAGGTGSAVARLYGVNTLGAFAGSAAAGFGLLPVLGLWGSTVVAALLNIAAGVVAILAAGREGEAAEAVGKKSERREEAVAAGPSPVAIGPRTLLLLYGLSGFAAMAYQVAWTRALILSMGASTYAFSAIVACFILGLGLGSVLIAPWVRRIRDPLSVAGLLEGGIGLSALLVVPLFGEMPGLVERLANSLDSTFGSILAIEALSVLGLLIVPTLDDFVVPEFVAGGNALLMGSGFESGMVVVFSTDAGYVETSVDLVGAGNSVARVHIPEGAVDGPAYVTTRGGNITPLKCSDLTSMAVRCEAGRLEGTTHSTTG